MTSAEKLAALLVERHNLKPPVDIERLLGEYAEIESFAWTHECDGLALLSGGSPKVFIKANTPLRRRRFTMAHELGHVICFWHIGRQDCTSVAPEGFKTQSMEETDANAFASAVLVPDTFLARFQDRYLPAPEILDELVAAEVSAQAGILALRRMLLPGYAFLVPGLEHPVLSTGTSVPPGTSDLAHIAKESGSHWHQGLRVRWYQFGAEETISLAAQASAATTQLLERAILAARPGQDVKRTITQINGVVGGTLTRAREASSPAAIFGALEQKFRNDPMYADLMSTEEFRLYLQQKAADVGSQRQKKALRSGGTHA